jgi:hypothetical protein
MVAEIVVNPTTIRSRPQRPPLLAGLSFTELLLIALYDQRNFHWLTLLLWQVDWTIYLYSFSKLYDIVLYSVYPSVLFPTIYGVLHILLEIKQMDKQNIAQYHTTLRKSINI